MNEKRETTEIDLKKLFFALLRKAWLILLVAVILAVVGYSYATFMLAPSYSSSVRLYVNNTYGVNSPGFSSSQLDAAQSLASTYMVFLDSRDVLTEVAKVSGLGYSVGEIKGMISAYAVNETEVFQVTVTCGNSKDAMIIANAVAEVLPVKISEFIEGSSVVVVEHAVENRNPVGPNVRKYMMVGFMAGAALVSVLVIVVSLLDTSIDDEEYLAQRYEDIPLLAVIPDTETSRGNGYKGYYEAQKSPAPKRKGGAK